MHPHRFCEHALEVKRGRRLFARISLNCLGYAKEYPVDIHELRLLPEENRALLQALLDYKTTHPDARIGPPYLWKLKNMASSEDSSIGNW
ncbi:hypothetical protein E2F46_06325 [Luteimonas aestuarii]|uniref:Uncharacterized protein n=1 Tax=Luteimonas aestuarii TaxID=453837 RepID=A0A4R5TYC7_9GAMM|nr:hypothetical protein [Luteimonas aestuarii]TDK26210.1 hypothetical protein E2F46_06325 [Luteimonas aestuarii]